MITEITSDKEYLETHGRWKELLVFDKGTPEHKERLKLSVLLLKYKYKTGKYPEGIEK